MIYTYLDNETKLWCVGCKIWGGGSWGNDIYKELKTGIQTKELAIIESNKYEYDIDKNDYKERTI